MFSSFFEATALMFVAYTGYGRVATLGEEITDPAKNIPRAVIITLALSFVVYLLVAFVSIGAVGAQEFYSATVGKAAPLKIIAETLGRPWVGVLLSIGAMTAMLGVLLNLVLGLSRVVFAMGRKGDLPAMFARVDARNHAPVVAILTSGLVVLSLVLLRDIKTAWSFSALTVLIYYAVTNLSALNLPQEKRLYPRILAWIGLAGCLSLGFWVEQKALVLGAVILMAGIVWRLFYRLISRKATE
jgi:APA family basic amino acid/polyamine antiporter